MAFRQKAITYIFSLVLAGLVAASPGMADDAPTPDPVSGAKPGGLVTLKQAFARALMHNPDLKAYSQEVRAREAETLQAGLMPNPALEVQVEDLSRNNVGSGKPSQSTFLLSQKLELGGKRGLREKAASLNRDLSGWDFQVARANVLNEVSRAFVDTLAAQENLKLMQELMRNAEEVKRTVSERVRVGKVSPIEETKAGVAQAETRMEWERALRDLKAARIRLASAWGGAGDPVDGVIGDLYAIRQIPTLETLEGIVAENPDVARWVTEIAHRQAVVDREKANAIPNLTVSGGLRRIEDAEDTTVVLGFSVPLAIFDRNQGTVRSAIDQLSRAESQQRSAKVKANAALGQAYEALSLAERELSLLNRDILPGARQTFDAVSEGYRFGKFSLLHVLDSQQTLFRARTQHIQALARFHQAAADIERLIGTPLKALNGEPAKEGTQP